jgi:predicted phosphodiesterase
MRIAVISDIHGNLEALLRVLEDIEVQDIQKVVCLGDNIGYGPEPNEVVRLIEEHPIPCVMGNHELGLIQPECLGWFNRSAKRSLLMTRDMLAGATMDYIRTLPPFLVELGGFFTHGCPPDRTTTYLFELSDHELGSLFEEIDQSLIFVGHTHDLAAVSFDGHGVRHFGLGKGSAHLKEGHRHIINVGSVGQPRDGNNNAKYVIWDQKASEIEVRFVPYDIAKTANKILELGLPKINASRLW